MQKFDLYDRWPRHRSLLLFSLGVLHALAVRSSGWFYGLHTRGARVKVVAMEIIELTSREHFLEAFPLIKQLRPHLDERRYLDLLGDMVPRGYRMFAVRDSAVLTAVAGIALTVNLYHGRHVWVYDLVTDERQRSRGVGKFLLEYVERFGRDQGCDRVSLSSGFPRTDAHRFYEERLHYERVSYVFTKPL